jgi:RNA polymerase-interacting CarD/CdnL/TRCF family regulator
VPGRTLPNPQQSGGLQVRHTGSVSEPPNVVVNLGDRPPGEWSRRYKANVARLRSGDREQVTEVVRRLTDREATIGLSQGEERMLGRAVEILHGFDSEVRTRPGRRPSTGIWGQAV